MEYAQRDCRCTRGEQGLVKSKNISHEHPHCIETFPSGGYLIDRHICMWIYIHICLARSFIWRSLTWKAWEPRLGSELCGSCATQLTPPPPLSQADITRWSLPSFTLTQASEAELFSTQHSRQATSKRSELACKMNLFLIPVQGSRTQIWKQAVWVEAAMRTMPVIGSDPVILTGCLTPVCFISCHLVYPSTA